MTEELIKLMLSVSGEDAVKDLREQLGYTEATLNQLKAAFARGELTTDEFLRAAKRLTDQEKQLQENIRLATDALNKQAVAADTAAEAVTANVEAVGKSGTSSAHKLMQLGQTLDDLQYVGEMGLRPIINNVMQIDSRLGILLIGVQSLINAFGEQLTKAVMGYSAETEAAANQTDRLAKKIEDLEKKPHKLAVDFKDLEEAQDRLDKLKADEAAYNSAKESDPEKQLGKEAQAAVTKYAGGADQLTAIVDAMERQSGFKHGDPSLYPKLARLKYQLENPEFDAKTGVAKYDPETTRKNITEVEAEIDRARQAYSKGQVAAFAAGDPAAIAAMQGRVARNPGAFNRMGLDGLTAGEAIRNLPATTQEMARRLQVDQEIGATDEAGAENMKDWRGIQARRGREAKEQERKEAKARADREEGEREASRLASKQADDQAKERAKSAQAVAKARAEKDAAEQRRQAELSTYRTQVGGVAGNVMEQNPGVDPAAAVRVAEEAVQLHRNFGLPLAAAQNQAVAAAVQGLSALQIEYAKLRQQQALIQGQLRRGRTMTPTTQPVPFAN